MTLNELVNKLSKAHTAEEWESLTSNISNCTDVIMFYEIRGNYDGWSIAKFKDGTMINRWHPNSPYYAVAQDVIEKTKEERTKQND